LIKIGEAPDRYETIGCVWRVGLDVPKVHAGRIGAGTFSEQDPRIVRAERRDQPTPASSNDEAALRRIRLNSRRLLTWIAGQVTAADALPEQERIKA
jgi:hypothetical protein